MGSNAPRISRLSWQRWNLVVTSDPGGSPGGRTRIPCGSHSSTRPIGVGMLTVQDSPWYPTARLFAKPGGHWGGVFDRVCDALISRVAAI